MVDVLIKNAFVVDGSGRPGFRADVAVKGDTITGVGDLRHLGAKRTIDAEGLVLSPALSTRTPTPTSRSSTIRPPRARWRRA